jgi:hypothetical protein
LRLGRPKREVLSSMAAMVLGRFAAFGFEVEVEAGLSKPARISSKAAWWMFLSRSGKS